MNNFSIGDISQNDLHRLKQNYTKINFLEISPFVRFVNYNSGPAYSYFIPKRIIYDFEMIYITEGKLMVESEEGNYSIDEGEIHFMKPKVIHKRYVPNDTFCSYYNLHFDLKYTGQDFAPDVYTKPCEEKIKEVPVNGILLNRMVYELSEMDLPTKMSILEPTRIVNVLDEMLDAYRKREFGYQLVLTANLLKILSITAENNRNNNQTTTFSCYSDQINKFTLYLLNHYQEKINLDEVARRMGMSSTYLRKIFKSIEQKTPQEYLIDLRIQKAKDLMKERKRSITEISNLVGYDDVHYFSRIFKKKENMTPTQYMAELKDIK